MFTKQKETDAPIHPVALFVVATLLGIFAATLFGADANGPHSDPPGLLPSMERAQPMPIPSDDVDLAGKLWQVLEAHDAGRLDEAKATWQALTLPQESEIWRQLGLGVAHLYGKDLSDAARYLEIARKLDPENAAVHYFMGVLRMEEAERSVDYADAIRTTPTRLISYRESDRFFAAGRSKSRCQLEAIDWFELAIQHEPDLDHDALLADVRTVVHALHPATPPNGAPTVADLLDALSANNLAGKSHALAAELYLAHGRPDEAEGHMDEAHASGIAVPYGHQRVGELYEEQSRFTDAFRVYTKAMKDGHGLARPAAKAFESMRKALEELP